MSQRRIGKIMPKRAGRICAQPGCSEIVHSGSRCAKHREVFHQQPYRAWYQSERWQSIRKQQLLLFPWCADCWKQGQMIQATEVDHVIPHRGDEQAFYAGPFQSLCASHHSQKTQLEMRVGL